MKPTPDGPLRGTWDASIKGVKFRTLTAAGKLMPNKLGDEAKFERDIVLERLACFLKGAPRER